MVRAVIAVVTVPAVLVAVILAANQWGRSGGARVVGQVPAAPPVPVTVRMEVQQSTVKVGEPIRATVFAFNHTNQVLRLTNCPSGVWPVMVLRDGGQPGSQHAFDPPMPCARTELPRGDSHFRVDVPTTLPAGVYQLQLAPGGLPAGSSLPAAVTVTLR